jgi:hypothetical protein
LGVFFDPLELQWGRDEGVAENLEGLPMAKKKRLFSKACG